jgi:dihydroorotate dehydrogenase electron transfer subunit
MESPKPTTVLQCKEIASGIHSLRFENVLEKNPEPGQFLMIWGGDDEKPMAATTVTEEEVTITIKVVGPTTRTLSEMRRGDIMGIRGPYGRQFDLSYEKPLLVAGGIGASPIRHLAKTMVDRDIVPRILIGFNTKRDAIYVKEIEGISKTEVCCLDGSFGLAGTTVENLPPLDEFDCVYTCGPERMMVGVARRADEEGVGCQLLVERYFKCGIGLCGSCSLGRLIPCTDGPVLTWTQLKDTEFGEFRRDRCGLKEDL